MLRRKETINGAQRLHTIIMARAAQEFHGNARFCASSSSNNAATSRKEKEEEEEEAVPRPPPPPISQPGRVQKIRTEGGRMEMNELSPSFFFSSFQVLSSSSLFKIFFCS